MDAILGEPRALWNRVPHPAVLMGRLISTLDTRVNHGKNRRLKGIISFAGLCGLMVAVGILLAALPLGWLFELIGATVLLAHRSLVDHVRDVAKSLRISEDSARVSVAKIVGRDTRDMNSSQISRAAIESAAENFSDGVVAPAFWFLIFGLPGLLLYKITNTADSMIGYRTPRHAEFGWAAARFDDLLNLIPARATAGMILLVTRCLSRTNVVLRDAPKHRSPNAGWPEAAMAVSLNLALAGPRSYEGEMRDFPFVNPQGAHVATAQDIDASVQVLWRVWGACLGVALLWAVF
jgi:adenosylcobinamide-phosphate synthase